MKTRNPARVRRSKSPGVLSTGIAGLDEILGGGLPRGRLFLVQGDPGAGKTTVGMQFLLEGVRQGERCLYMPLSETTDETHEIARSHGWKLDGIDIYEIADVHKRQKEAESTLFHPSEVELDETMDEVLTVAERVKPRRLVFDSLSELRLLATNQLRYRRQILALKKIFATRDCTVVLLDDRTGPKDDTASLAHGLIELAQDAPVYGPDRRRLRVTKMRGVKFREGFHDIQIERGGLVVHPRLTAPEHGLDDEHSGALGSGIPNLDRMLDGGLGIGTTALFMGPAGSGKSSLAMQYVIAAAARGDHAAIFNFDESVSTVYRRAKALGTDLKKLVKQGKVQLTQVEPTELPPGELVTEVRAAVEKRDARVVVLDSINGYMQSMPEESFMLTHLHDLLAYLRHKGVVTILVVAQHGLFGGAMKAPVDVSYLADTVVVFRYFEHRGRIRKAISVLKNRTGGHESSIRELSMDRNGFRVGKPLENFEGVMQGVPSAARPPKKKKSKKEARADDE